MTDTTIIEKVQKLLAKAEDKGVTAEEAETFFAKAQELMTKHAIDEARVRASKLGHYEEPVVVKFVFSTNDANIPGKTQILSAIAKANGCRIVLHPAPWERKNYKATIVGFQSDVDFVQLLYASAFMQAARDARRLKLTKAQTTGFLLGFANAVAERLKKAEETVTSAAPGTDLVLASRSDDVNAKLRTEFPNLKSSVASRASNWTQYGRGRDSGMAANLSGGRGAVGSRRALGK